MELKAISEDYIKLLQEIRIYFKNSKNSIHKARNEIKIIDYKDKSLVVKAFKVPNLFNKIVYTFFRDTKAKKSYYNSLKIADFVPRAVGYIEFKKFGLLNDSYFVSEKFDYDFSIREVLLDEKFDNREAIFAEFSEFTFGLHEKGILHKDYSPGNILIKKEDNSYIFKIVDINRMEFKELDIDERLKNFSQLWANDNDLKIIIDAYLEFMTEDRESCLQKAIHYSKKHKNIKNFKKRLKGRKVVD
ncbi:MAG: hypothetical protein QG565_969 [Campylobacterota bacterium]|nr:hypothetical protein [Campylobacterota bacterium]